MFQILALNENLHVQKENKHIVGIYIKMACSVSFDKGTK